MPNSPEPNTFGYNAEQTDFTSGIQYLRARYYHTAISRFFQEDDYKGSFTSPISMNKYVYCENNPITNIDPSGHASYSGVPSNIANMLERRDKAQEYKNRYSKPVSATPFPTQAELKGQWYKDYYTSDNRGATPFPQDAVQTPAKSLEEEIKNCSFNQVNGMIYDDMDFSKFTISELQALYDKIDRLDVGKKAFDNVKNKNKFLRKLQRYIRKNKPNNLTENEKNNLKSDGILSIVAGVAAVAVGVTAAIVGAPVVLGAAVVVALVGVLSVGMGAANINEANTGSNWVKEKMFFGNEQAYGLAQAGLFIGSVAGAATLLPYAAAGIAGTKIWQSIANNRGTTIKISGSGSSTAVSVGPSTSTGFQSTQSTITKAVTYSPVNPGPLSKDTAETFNGANYTEKALTQDTTMYRVYGGSSRQVGSYMTKVPQNGGIQSQIDLGLNPDWGNTAEYVSEVIVPQGTIIYEGTAAPQIINGGAGQLLGGGNQIYIPEVSPDWFN